MNDGRASIQDTLPRSVRRRVVQVCDRYEQADRAGRGLRIEDCVADVPEPERPAVLRELIALDLRLRRERGEDPTPREYYDRFPDQTAPIESVFLSLALEAHRGKTDLTASRNPPGPDPRGADDTMDRADGPGMTPRTIGKYVILDQIDKGGQGRVFRVLHPQLQGEFVLKLAHRPLEPGSPRRGSLLAEGRILARLDHPNLARVVDLDFDCDFPFLVLECVRGRTLDRYAADDRPTPQQAARIVAELAQAVAYLHGQGVVHQDIKPRNVVLDGAGRPRLIDFGLAQLRQAWSDSRDMPSGGTPQFMAPEQARGESERVGPASDIFALGGLLYFLLTGRPPFDGATAGEARAQAARCAFDRTALRGRGIPRWLARTVLRAMAADPADRHPRAEDLARDLERFVALPRRLRRLVAAGSGVVFLLLVAFLAPVFVVLAVRTSSPRGLKVTNLADEGEGSLRQAILEANDVAEHEEITFASGITGTIQLGGALPDLVSDVTIRGPGARKLRVRRNAGEEYSILTIARTGKVELSGLTISNGLANNGGGIYNVGSLTIRNCDISHNRALHTGGGVYNAGTLAVDSSTLSGNFAKEGGGGICNSDTATVTIRSSLLASNTASFDSGGNGGGIYCDGSSTLTLRSTTLSGSSAYNGGGMYCSGGVTGFSGKVTIDSSTIANNRSRWSGGGIFFAPSNTGTLLVQSSTISGNSVERNEGGGIVIWGNLYLKPGIVTVRVVSSTISGNASGFGGGVYNASKWAGFFVDNTIIAKNLGRMGDPDIHGAAVVSGSHNLIGIGTGMSGIRNGVNGNRVGTEDHPIDPKLGPLQDNGGPTFTHALESHSPAVGAGDNEAAPATDQRGLPRVVNGTIDLGAYELQQPDRLAIRRQ